MVILAADHAGYELKEEIKKYLVKNKYDVVDVGAFEINLTDSYVPFVKLAVSSMQRDPDSKAIVCCGSGIGVNIACNRFNGIYAVVGTSVDQVKLARLHNNANVLNFGGRVISSAKAKPIVRAFLESPFEGGRHIPRIQELDKLVK